ncbi:MAG: nucleoside triphosphate pyrophosphohydrolase [Thermodesulfobacteriota bacterium]
MTKCSADSFVEIIDLIHKLRAPGGCPWDRKQTAVSIKPYLLEETHELAEAIDQGHVANIREELGDLYFQISFIALLFEEEGQFTVKDVLDGIIAKMVRRHPHVFTDEEFASDEAIRQNWQKIKAQEKKEKAAQEEESSNVDVPRSLPGLNRSQRVSARVAAHGFEWPDNVSLMAKFSEECQELHEAVSGRNKEEISEEIGDVLFMLVNICRRHDLYGEDIIHQATDKFINRFETMEGLCAKDKTSLAEENSAAQLRYWQRAKEELATPAEAATGGKEKG